MFKNELLEKITQDIGYPHSVPTELSLLFLALLQTHDLSDVNMEDGLSGLSQIDMLGAFLIDIPIFHYSYLYEVLDCLMPSDHARIYISRLIKKEQLKKVPIASSSDKELSSIYYLTKAGYNFLAKPLANCSPYRSKNGQRLKETALHDFGVGAAYLSFIRSPFEVEPVYEMANMFEKASAPVGKHLRKSLRPDAILNYHSNETFGKIYVEHDTGHESVSRMIDKLNLYVLHGILSAGSNGSNDSEHSFEYNAILYTFRKGCKQRPLCFSRRRIQRLIANLPEGLSIDMYEPEDRTLSEVLVDLKKWTPAFRKHWTKEELKEYEINLHKNTEPSLIRYQRYYQRTEGAKRRNKAFRLLIQEFERRDRSEYYPALTEMLHGYPVWFCPFNHVTNSLPAFFMTDYPRTIAWIQEILIPYYGEVTYMSRQYRFANSSGGRELTLNNIFETNDGNKIAVEYISCDLSALIRLYAICQGEYELKSTPFDLILLVDSYKDASDILEYCNPLFKLGNDFLYRSGVLDLSFLSLTGNYLFSISKDGREVKILD